MMKNSIKKLSFVLIILMLGGCSFQSPKNEWQVKSTNAYASYTQNFLIGNDLMAKNDLSRAVKHAKQSADLTQLSTIYLGKCALNISVGVDDNCDEYKEVSDLINNKQLDAYYHLLTASLEPKHIAYLPKQYKKFSEILTNNNLVELDKNILSMEKTTSKILAASLAKDKLTQSTKKEISKIASYHGYKKVVLFWLEESKKTSSNSNEIENINRKISILNSN